MEVERVKDFSRAFVYRYMENENRFTHIHKSSQGILFKASTYNLMIENLAYVLIAYLHFECCIRRI